MRNVLFALVILSTSVSCAKDYSADSLLGSWRVIELRDTDEEDFVKEEGDVVITFNDRTLEFRTTVNSCGTSYEATDNGGLSLEAVGCTRVCCDSDTETQLIRLLPKMTEFEIKNRSLLLFGEGEIELKRQ